MKNIRLSPAANITITGTGVVLNSDLGTFRLKGEDLGVFIEQMIPLLDGQLTREGVAAAISDYSDASVLQLLSMLDERGLLENAGATDAEEGLTGPQERFTKILGADLLENVKKSRILIIGLEPWSVTAALELAATGVRSFHFVDDRNVNSDDLLAMRHLSEIHIGKSRKDILKDYLTEKYGDIKVKTDKLKLKENGELSFKPNEFDLIITGLNADEYRVLRAVTHFAQQHDLPSLNGHLDGQEAWVGPVLIPGQSGCWDCYRLRKLGNAQNVSGAHEFDNALLAERPPQRGRAMLAPMAPLVGHLMAVDALRILGLNEGNTPAGSFRILNMLSGESESHSFIPMPWCDICGGAASARGEMDPLNISEDPATHILNNVRDGETLRALMGGWIDKRAGVIKELVLTPEGQSLTLPRTASANVAGFTQGEMKSAANSMMGSGKSLSAINAEIGALGEAIERYSASRYQRDETFYASIDGLEGEALDPSKLPLYTDAQYQSKHFPCTPWDPSQKIHWVEGQWIGSDKPVWVPALPTFFNFFVPHKERFCQVSSNGLAAGGDFKDSAIRATYELLERDAFMLNWLCELPGRQLIIDEGLSPELALIMDQLNSQGASIEFWVLDDLGTGIPTVVCVGLGDGKRWGGTSIGLSCHSDIRIAAQKALLEQAHFGPYLSRIMQNSKIPETAEDVRSLEDHALYYVPPSRRNAFDFMRKSENKPLLYSQTKDWGSKKSESSYDYLAKCLDKAGLKVAAVDVTSPDVRLSPFRVARAIGEFVQPIHFGFQNRPLANERLMRLLDGRGVNQNPHPIA